MTERQQVTRELMDASDRRHKLLRQVGAQLNEALRAVEAVRRGEVGAARLLSNLCRVLSYEGDVLCIPVDALIAAEDERTQALARLKEIDGVEVEAP